MKVAPKIKCEPDHIMHKHSARTGSSGPMLSNTAAPAPVILQLRSYEELSMPGYQSEKSTNISAWYVGTSQKWTSPREPLTQEWPRGTMEKEKASQWGRSLGSVSSTKYAKRIGPRAVISGLAHWLVA